MTDVTQPARRERLSDNSKELLDAIDDLHTLEEGKRAELVSTPAFHELADEVRRLSRSVFAMASDEVEQADQLETTDVSLDDVGGLHVDSREETASSGPPQH